MTFKKYFINLKRLKALNLNTVALTDSSLGDDVDVAQAERSNLLETKLLGRDTEFLKCIDSALDRIEAGDYGCCEECGSMIEAKRLKARPTAKLCLHCQEEIERDEQQVLYHRRSKTHGKEIQLATILTFPSRELEEVIPRESDHKTALRKHELGVTGLDIA